MTAAHTAGVVSQGATVIAEVISPDARFFQLYREKGRIEAKNLLAQRAGRDDA